MGLRLLRLALLSVVVVVQQWRSGELCWRALLASALEKEGVAMAAAQIALEHLLLADHLVRAWAAALRAAMTWIWQLGAHSNNKEEILVAVVVCSVVVQHQALEQHQRERGLLSLAPLALGLHLLAPQRGHQRTSLTALVVALVVTVPQASSLNAQRQQSGVGSLTSTCVSATGLQA